MRRNERHPCIFSKTFRSPLRQSRPWFHREKVLVNFVAFVAVAGNLAALLVPPDDGEGAHCAPIPRENLPLCTAG